LAGGIFFVAIFRVNPDVQITSREVPRHNGAQPIDALRSLLRSVEPPPTVTRLLVKAVALKAVVRKDRPHIAIELDLLRQRWLFCGGGNGSSRTKAAARRKRMWWRDIRGRKWSTQIITLST
jgi:hypothetical protein